MGLTMGQLFCKLSEKEQKTVVQAIEEILEHGHGELNVKVQDGKIVFVQGFKNYKT